MYAVFYTSNSTTWISLMTRNLHLSNNGSFLHILFYLVETKYKSLTPPPNLGFCRLPKSFNVRPQKRTQWVYWRQTEKDFWQANFGNLLLIVEVQKWPCNAQNGRSVKSLVNQPINSTVKNIMVVWVQCFKGQVSVHGSEPSLVRFDNWQVCDWCTCASESLACIGWTLPHVVWHKSRQIINTKLTVTLPIHYFKLSWQEMKNTKKQKNKQT